MRTIFPPPALRQITMVSPAEAALRREISAAAEDWLVLGVASRHGLLVRRFGGRFVVTWKGDPIRSFTSREDAEAYVRSLVLPGERA